VSVVPPVLSPDEPPLPELAELPPLPELPSLLPDENDQQEATRTPSDSARDSGAAERIFFICDISRVLRSFERDRRAGCGWGTREGSEKSVLRDKSRTYRAL
jgi:hypothetical protein